MIDSLIAYNKTDTLVNYDFPHFDAAPIIDTSGFVSVVECKPNPIVVYTKEDKELLGFPISAWIAVGAFFLGWLFTRGFMHLDEERARKRYRKTVLDWIELIERPENNLIGSLRKLSKAVSCTEDMQPIIFRMPNTIPDKIKDLSVESMMDAFKDIGDEKQRNKNLYIIISMFDFLTKINGEILKEYDRYNRQATQLCKEWNQIFIPFSAVMELSEGDLKAIYDQWMDDLAENPNAIDTHHKYLERILQIESLKKDQIITILNLERIVMQIQENRKYAKVFGDLAKRIKLSVKELKKASRYFREQPNCD